VSRGKKPRARARGRAAAPAAKPKPRIEATRRRVAAAKLGVAGVALVGFAGALGFSRVSYAGHSKQPLRPLVPPPRYVEIVRQNLLQAGIVAPAQAPPGAATSTS
jgi:hypothetical protein